MFPLHTDLAFQLAREHAAEEHRRAARHQLARDARGPRPRRAWLAVLTGFLRRDGDPGPAGQTQRPRPGVPLPQAVPVPRPASSTTRSPDLISPATHLMIRPLRPPRRPEPPSMTGVGGEARTQRRDSRP
ncbi:MULTISPECIES: hypothetical protein [Pseudofrankia]|uniref:hypothetical protein n=1 Tax=Pseudofrankia TaxID=2994363 RepID=UPI000234C124|nr:MULTISPECIES: hypothetical protein [Pseudofrankia]